MCETTLEQAVPACRHRPSPARHTPPPPQDLKAKNRRLQQDLAALAQAKLQHAGTIPTNGAALAAAADGIDQLVGGLMAAFIWLIAAAWRATLCTCAAAWHGAYCACAAAWWAWACRGWAARWAPLVTRISDTATSAARHTLSFAVAALRHSRQLAQQASATVQHSTAAARTCMGTWTAMVAGKVAGKVAAALDMVRRSAAAAYQGASHSAATAGAAARCHVTATAATAKHTALRATRLVAAQVQARPCSSIASALLAAYLLGRLTSPGKLLTGVRRSGQPGPGVRWVMGGGKHPLPDAVAHTSGPAGCCWKTGRLLVAYAAAAHALHKDLPLTKAFSFMPCLHPPLLCRPASCCPHPHRTHCAGLKRYLCAAPCCPLLPSSSQRRPLLALF